MRPVVLAFAFALSVAAVRAETPAPAAPNPLERDLGRGLVYYRALNLPGDLPAAVPDKQARILDLRFAQGEAAANSALIAWLKLHATPRTPVFILANAKTKPALLARLAGHDPAAGILVVGPQAPDFLADIAVKVSDDEDRRAYDAFATASISSLLIDQPNKPRNDEARLTKEHLSDGALTSETPGDTDPPASDATASAAPPKPAPPVIVDVVLQRAVHLHRALLALKKL
jgi:hypothetical protein